MSREFAPQPLLQQYIKCFWTLEAEQSLYNRNTILPDSYAELVFNCGAPLFLETARGATIELPRVFLLGIQKNPLRLRTTGLCQLIAVRLYAWSVSTLVGVQTNATIIPLDGKWHDFADTLENTVRHNGYEESVARLQQWMADLFPPTNHALGWMQSVGNTLYATHGQVRISDLVAQSYLSPRQFERDFKRLTGLLPKTLARLIRFEAVRDFWMCNPSGRITDLVQQFGYTDQAHFIHDFKAFAACTPGECATYMRKRAAQMQDDVFLQSS